MKLRTIKIKKYKLLRLYLMKYQAYKKKLLFSSYSKFLDQLELKFKKALFVIYQYHIWNKKILFVGLPHSNNKNFQKILLRSNHNFIPISMWINGLIGNKNSITSYSKISYYFKNFLKIQTTPHLIVLFNGLNSLNLVSEASKLDIPIIYFGDIYRKIPGVLYLIEGNFLKTKFKNYYQFLIYSILKKSKNRVVKKVKQKRKQLVR